MKRGIKFLLATIILIIIIILGIRNVNPREIDDLSPGIYCDQTYLEKSDIVWVIPMYNNIPLNESWCKEIRKMNKTFGLHGIRHSYNEFGSPITQEDLNKGIEIFTKCIGYKPKLFKPPQLNITDDNIKLIEKNDMLVRQELNAITHKIYHCDEHRNPPNRLVDFT